MLRSSEEKLARKYCLNTHDQNKHCSSSTMCMRSRRELEPFWQRSWINFLFAGRGQVILLILIFSMALNIAALYCTQQEFRTNSQEGYVYSDETQEFCKQMWKALAPTLPSTSSLLADHIPVNIWQWILVLPFLIHTQALSLLPSC